MSALSKEKKELLKKINCLKVTMDHNLKRKFITDEDLVSILNKDVNFLLLEQKNPKEKILNQIANCPFLLFDQPEIRNEMKPLIEFLVDIRFNMEKDELDLLFKEGYMTENQYNKNLDNLVFCYYKSSEEGQKVFDQKNKTYCKKKV